MIYEIISTVPPICFVFFAFDHLGSGYLVACFASMVGPQGRAVGIEHIPELVSASIENIQKSAASPFLELGSLSVHVGGIFLLRLGFLFLY